MPIATIRADLERTGSVNLTIENIFEGRLVAPPQEEEYIPEPAPAHEHHHDSHSSPRSSPPTRRGQLTLSEEIEQIESSLVDVPAGFGSSPSERQRMLEQRKQAMQQRGRLYVSCCLRSLSSLVTV